MDIFSFFFQHIPNLICASIYFTADDSKYICLSQEFVIFQNVNALAVHRRESVKYKGEMSWARTEDQKHRNKKKEKDYSLISTNNSLWFTRSSTTHNFPRSPLWLCLCWKLYHFLNVSPKKKEQHWDNTLWHFRTKIYSLQIILVCLVSLCDYIQAKKHKKKWTHEICIKMVYSWRRKHHIVFEWNSIS